MNAFFPGQGFSERVKALLRILLLLGFILGVVSIGGRRSMRYWVRAVLGPTFRYHMMTGAGYQSSALRPGH